MSLTDVLPFITQNGAIGILAVMWWLERADKKSAEAENAKLVREIVAHTAEQKLLSANILTLLGKNQQ